MDHSDHCPYLPHLMTLITVTVSLRAMIPVSMYINLWTSGNGVRSVKRKAIVIVIVYEGSDYHIDNCDEFLKPS